MPPARDRSGCLLRKLFTTVRELLPSCSHKLVFLIQNNGRDTSLIRTSISCSINIHLDLTSREGSQHLSMTPLTRGTKALQVNKPVGFCFFVVANLSILHESEIEPASEDAGSDMCVWRWSERGVFTVSDAFQFTFRANEDRNLVWKTRGPQRARQFLWIVLHNRIMTNLERGRRHLTDDISCLICGAWYEDTKHTIRSCSAAMEVWKRVIPCDKLYTFLNKDFNVWLRENLLCNAIYDGFCWSTFFSFVVLETMKEQESTDF